ncbi:Ger(x)C family spore germination protein [Paenibacillus mesophilus]|uniref:Ger(x)C family spore germination protein n=1 Tax=Paenibacillus mesophilus TaxID=2582849 RepID=UPI00110D38B8|nr:Ger(x)C family spore germination protein [Paenibacillus mesophilus]TMV45523.1 Ger(x)C family spore germination protein [Paenibacillus mesophilus]
MKRAGVLLFICVLLLLPAGCWNSKDIQNMAYVTAIGLDYENEHYITYIQVLNFSNVAKSESAQVGKNIPVWIGRGEGVTVTESLNSIYSTSQLRVFWGHVKSIVCTETFLKNGQRVKEAYDMLNRYREIRYNVLMYGTKESLRDIFTQKSLLNLSPLDTIMDTPSQIYSQRSYIVPVYGYKIIAQFNEPAQSAMLPSISIDKKSWTEDKKAKPMFKIDGSYYFHASSLIGWLSEGDLQGYRWLQKKLERSPIHIPDNSAPDAAIVLIKPKPRIHPVVRDGKVTFNISLRIKAYVDELTRNIPKAEIEEMSAKVISDQIRATFLNGLEIKVDVLQLGECLYRKYPKVWHDMHSTGEFILNESSLDRIDVKVNLLHTGKYKGRID